MYVVNIPQEYVLHFVPFFGDTFFLLQDSARPQTAAFIFLYRSQKGGNLHEKNPDLNPRTFLGYVRKVCQNLTHTLLILRELPVVLMKEWDSIVGQVITRIILSIPEWLEEAQSNKGGTTHQ